MRFRRLITELRRRRVFRTTGYYIVAAWVAVQVASLLFPAFDIPDEALFFVWATVAALFPIALVFAWRFDVSMDGITRTPPASPGEAFDPSLQRSDFLVIALLALVGGAVALQFLSRIETGGARLDESIREFSIAVLPLDDLSGNPDERFFASGMQASLIDGLSRISRLRVTSKVSTQRFRNAELSLADIANELGVARILEGTVLRAGGRVSLATRLYDVRADKQIWSARYEDDLDNVMLLQAKIAQEVANQIRVELTAMERDRFADAAPIDSEAYLAYLRGVFHVERFNPQDMTTAAIHFERAVEIAPDLALAHWGLGKLCTFKAQAGIITPAEARAQCQAPIRRALELDPTLAEAHFGLAATATWQFFDWETARRHWQRALQLNPSSADAHMFYAHFLGIVGELEESTRHIERAVELDPFNPFVHGIYSIQLLMRDEFDRAIEVAEKALSMAPGYAFAHLTLWGAHDALGNQTDSIEALAEVLRQVWENPEAAEFLEAAFARDGYASASRQLAELLTEQATNTHVPAAGVLYEQAGDVERAIDYYERAYASFDPNAPYLGALTKKPEVRRHPRFRALLMRMGLDYWAALP